MLKWLAIGGWGTFAVEWLVMLLVLTSLVGQGGRVKAEAAPQREAKATPPTSAQSATPTPRTATPAAPVVAPSATSAKANVLGMTLSRGHTVVLVDAVEQSRPWMNQAKAKLIAGLSQPGLPGATFSIAVINNNSGRSLTNERLTYGPAVAGKLRSALNPLQIKGTKGLGTGLDTAGKLGADQIIFITSRNQRWGAYVTFLEGKLSLNGKRIRLDVVQVNDKASTDLQKYITGANNGQYRVVTPGSI